MARVGAPPVRTLLRGDFGFGGVIGRLRRIGLRVRLGIELGEERKQVAVLGRDEFIQKLHHVLGEGVVGVLLDVREEERAGDDLAAGFAFSLLCSFARVESFDLGDQCGGIACGNACAGGYRPVAIYSCSASVISRSGGRCAVAAAAYQSGSKITDERQGVVWDFTRKRGVLHSEMVLPDYAPEWASDRERLWNEVERAEDKSTRRAEAKTGREFRIALPHELTPDERIAAAQEFSRFLVQRYGVAVDMGVHAPDRRGDSRNFHAHVLMTTRALGEDGFGAKVRILDSFKTSAPEMEAIREAWETIANRALEAGGHETRIDRRSFERQGVDREATIHVGASATEMERNGQTSERGDINREIEARNVMRARMAAELSQVEAQIIDLDAERAKREAAKDEKAIRSEAKTLDPDRILTSLTERRATFSRGDLNRALTEILPDPKTRSAFTDKVLAQETVIPLRENESAPVSRYTTREVLSDEKRISDAAARMEERTAHGVSAGGTAEALDRHPKLDAEQRAALDRATGPEGFTMIAGEAGTGKSTTLAAIRDAYEADGFRVQGLSWKNDVVQGMRRDGFSDTSTILAELMRQNGGHGTAWNSRTVLMVDEAAMLSSKHLAAFLTKADAAGAKVILVGDAQQLGSIERGGMFEVLQRQHGAAELHTVRRDQRASTISKLTMTCIAATSARRWKNSTSSARSIGTRRPRIRRRRLWRNGLRTAPPIPARRALRSPIPMPKSKSSI